MNRKRTSNSAMRKGPQKCALLLIIMTLIAFTFALRGACCRKSSSLLACRRSVPLQSPCAPLSSRLYCLALAAAVGGASSFGSLNGDKVTACAPPETTFPPEVLKYDHYSGVTLDLEKWQESSNGDVESESNFSSLLAASLQQWREEQRRGIWMYVSASQSDKIHAAMEQGFEFHMVVDRKLVLTKWLDDSTPSRLPIGPTHQVGVGCLVFHPKDSSKMLVVQEKTGPAAAFNLWKMPTGLADPGEDIHDAAVRELLEETGLRGRFTGILSFRQAHSTHRGSVTRTNSDLFFVCRVELLEGSDVDSSAFQACPTEIDAIQWMPVEEYCAQERWQGSPVYLEMNRAILEASKHALFDAHTLPLGFAGGTNALYKSTYEVVEGNSEEEPPS